MKTIDCPMPFPMALQTQTQGPIKGIRHACAHCPFSPHLKHGPDSPQALREKGRGTGRILSHFIQLDGLDQHLTFLSIVLIIPSTVHLKASSKTSAWAVKGPFSNCLSLNPM